MNVVFSFAFFRFLFVTASDVSNVSLLGFGCRGFCVDAMVMIFDLLGAVT